MRKLIIVPEPHISCTNIEGRKDYLTEIESYIGFVQDLIKKDSGICWVCFVGDIFNKGFKDIEEYLGWVDWFTQLDKLLTQRGGCIYSVVGNHELSYSKNNPFWRLVSKDSFNTVCNWNTKAVSPKGLRDIIHVQDVVEISDKLSLFFCHYDGMAECRELVDEHIKMFGDSKQRVCISHNSIISYVIENTLKMNYGRDPLTHFISHERIESLSLFHKFDYVFNGHMHKAYSNFTITDTENNKQTKLFYLGSLGRTNSEEINDKDLERMIPCIDVDDLTFTPHYLTLWSRQDSLVEGYDNKKMEMKLSQQSYDEICEHIIDISNPVEEVMNALDDRDMAVALECAVSGVMPQTLLNLTENVNEVMYR